MEPSCLADRGGRGDRWRGVHRAPAGLALPRTVLAVTVVAALAASLVAGRLFHPAAVNGPPRPVWSVPGAPPVVPAMSGPWTPRSSPRPGPGHPPR